MYLPPVNLLKFGNVCINHATAQAKFLCFTHDACLPKWRAEAQSILLKQKNIYILESTVYE